MDYNFKYIQIFEKFNSDKLSKIFKYLSSSGKKEFREDLKILSNSLDFPLSELSDDQFKYLNFKNGFAVKDDEKSKYLKFWFNVNGDYIGPTYFKNDSESISNYNIEKIELRDCNKSQKVYVDFDGVDKFICTIWVDRYGEKYAIHNNYRKRGGCPHGIEWKIYGEESWLLYHGDFRSIYKIDPKSDRPNDDPEDYNHIADLHGSKWKSSSTSTIKNYLKSADFCFILDVNLISPKDKISSIRSNRKNIKSGSLSLKSNNEIKQENLEKYLNKLSEYNPNLEIDQFNNILLRINGWNVPLYFIYYKTNFEIIQEIIYFMSHWIKTKDHGYAKEVSRLIKKGYTSSQKARDIQSKIDYSMKMSKKDGREKITEFLTIFNDLNRLIKNFILRGSIETVPDIEIKLLKLKMMNGAMIGQGGIVGISVILQWLTTYDEVIVYEYLKGTSDDYFITNSKKMSDFCKSIEKI